VELGNAGDIERAMAEAGGVRGRIDVMVNCAGIYREGPFAEIDDVTIDELIDTNLKGLVRATRAALRFMPSDSCVINIASMSGVRSLEAQSVYAATKAAVIHFGACLARELAPRGIRVNTVSPGPAKTPLIYTVLPADRVPQAEAWLAQRIPLGRLVEPSEVAEAVTYLASARSATGAHIVLDGGTVL
jgi:NAD(P)-dependent dehydrogenase (short-subunit alcohol dehydrogenase family)